MNYIVGQKVLFSPLNKGEKEQAIIIERGVDYLKGYIDTPNAKGRFDYLISVERNGKNENVFCMKDELK